MAGLPADNPSPGFGNQPSGQILPFMPVATQDNFVQALNAVRQVVQQLGDPATTQKGNNQSDTANQRGRSASNKKQPAKKPRWTEKSRTTVKVRVYNPKDKTQYVDFEQINTLIMQDTITGGTWEWKR